MTRTTLLITGAALSILGIAATLSYAGSTGSEVPDSMKPKVVLESEAPGGMAAKPSEREAEVLPPERATVAPQRPELTPETIADWQARAVELQTRMIDALKSGDAEQIAEAREAMAEMHRQHGGR